METVSKPPKLTPSRVFRLVLACGNEERYTAYVFRWKVLLGRLVAEMVTVCVAVARRQFDNDAILDRRIHMGRHPALHDV